MILQATTTGDPSCHSECDGGTLGASNIEKATVGAKKELRGIVGQKKEGSPAEPEICEACQ